MTKWLTDRSRYLTGLQHCQMARFLKYHSGPSGYGITRKAQALPLVTGVMIHECLAKILEEVKRSNHHIPTRSFIREVINNQITLYRTLILNRGFANLNEEQELLIKEQTSLMEGLVWGWFKIMLPGLVEEFELIEIEREEELEVAGIVMMSRPDFVARERSTGKLSIHDFKSAAYVNDSWVEEYRESVQMAVGTLGVEARLGEKVETYYIHALIKGLRKKEYDSSSGDYTGPKTQTSFLCYGYYKEANPPLNKSDWQAKYKYLGQDGKKHLLGKYYTKTPIWEARFENKPPEMSNGEYWVMETLPIADLQELFIQIGPYERQENLIAHYIPEMVNEEKRWIQRLWRIHEAKVEFGEASEEFQDTLREEIPRSWECRKYNSVCEFLPICHNHSQMWEFVPRAPHHAPEALQMKSRGIEIPSDTMLDLNEEVDGE